MKGAGEIGFTILSISISLVAVFIPLLLMNGVVGKLFQEFAVTVAVAIGVSAFVSLTLTPMLCAYLLQHVPAAQARHGRLYRLLENGFDRLAGGYDAALTGAAASASPLCWSCSATVAVTGYLYRRDPEGLLSAAGYRPHRRRHRGGPGYLDLRPVGQAAAGRRCRAQGSGRRLRGELYRAGRHQPVAATRGGCSSR